MKLYYYAIDGDDIGACLEKHALSNDVDAIKRLSSSVHLCLKKIREHLEDNSAAIVFCGGDSILAISEKKIPITIDNLTFGEFSFSVGVGSTCCNATLALKKAKGLGKKRIETML